MEGMAERGAAALHHHNLTVPTTILRAVTCIRFEQLAAVCGPQHSWTRHEGAQAIVSKRKQSQSPKILYRMLRCQNLGSQVPPQKRTPPVFMQVKGAVPLTSTVFIVIVTSAGHQSPEIPMDDSLLRSHYSQHSSHVLALQRFSSTVGIAENHPKTQMTGRGLRPLQLERQNKAPLCQ